MTPGDTAAPTGRELLEAIRDGRLAPAPIQRVLDFDLVEVADGRVVFLYRPSGDHRNPMGTVHGGVAMTLLDSAAGASLHSTLAAGEAYTTLETKVNLVRTIRPDGAQLRAEGSVIHRGATTATAEARLVDEAGKLFAHGTSTCLILQG
jgi:uncharacterized protein (TIGR00369 family)